MTTLRFRPAGFDDAGRIAALHADSWQRHYRGAYTDAFLDGDVLAERRAVWSSRLAAPHNSFTMVAEDGEATAASGADTPLVGFVHVVFDQDERWGSLIDNLHVVHSSHHSGIGTSLIRLAAQAVAAEASGQAVYLWVLEQNVAAQRFYHALGGTRVERTPTPAPSGDPSRLNGSPHRFRIAWPEAALLLKATAR